MLGCWSKCKRIIFVVGKNLDADVIKYTHNDKV